MMNVHVRYFCATYKWAVLTDMSLKSSTLLRLYIESILLQEKVRAFAFHPQQQSLNSGGGSPNKSLKKGILP